VTGLGPLLVPQGPESVAGRGVARCLLCSPEQLPLPNSRLCYPTTAGEVPSGSAVRPKAGRTTSAGMRSRKSAQSFINRWRFSNRSPRQYAPSVLPATV
jgi:hypothetical protein